MLSHMMNGKVKLTPFYKRCINTLLGLSLVTYLWYIDESIFKYVFLGLAISIYQDFNSQDETKNIKNAGLKGLIITDPAEDCDDEAALAKLFEMTKAGLQGFSQVFIAFAPGVHYYEKTGMDRMKVFQKFFPEYKSNNFIINSTKVHLLPAEKLKSMYGYEFDVFLQIAPLSNIGAKFFQNNKIGRRIVMGDLNNPSNSINLSKTLDTDELFQEFDAQEEALVNIPSTSITTGLSRQVPFTCSIIKSLPSELSTLVKNKSFDLLVGRVPPTSVYCENVTINANWMTAKNYLGKNSSKALASLKKEHEMTTMVAINRQVEEFMDKMTSLKDRSKMKEALIDIYLTVEYITGSFYIGSDFNVTSLKNVEEARYKYIEYIDNNNCSLTPAYDLLAMHLMLNPEMKESCYDESYAEYFKKEMVKHYG